MSNSADAHDPSVRFADTSPSRSAMGRDDHTSQPCPALLVKSSCTSRSL